MDHGTHWACIYKNHRKQLPKALAHIVDDGEVLDEAPWPDDTRPPDDLQPDSLMVMSDKEGSLRHLVISLIDKTTSKQMIWTAYPFAPGGASYDLQVTAIHDWENGAEGNVTGRIRDVGRITFFDTLFWINRKIYTPGGVYKVYLTALASELRPISATAAAALLDPRAAPTDADEPAGGAAGAAANPPAAVAAVHSQISKVEDGPADEYEFVSQVKHASQFAFGDGEFYAIGITLMRRGNVSVDVDLYVAPHVLPKRYVPAAEHYVTGRLWLQGHIAM